MSIKKMLFLTGLTLVMAGAGCANTAYVPVSPAATNTVSNTQSAPVSASVHVGNDVDEAAYAVVVDDAYTTQQNTDGVRIQNFVGSDDPKTTYPDEAFFVEIRDVGTSYTMENFRKDYVQVTPATLGGRAVQFGAGGVMGGDTWQHEGYFDDQSNTLIVLYVNALPGSDLAQALVKGIQWK